MSRSRHPAGGPLEFSRVQVLSCCRGWLKHPQAELESLKEEPPLQSPAHLPGLAAMPKLPTIPSGEALHLQAKQRKTGLLSPLGTSSEEEEETTMDETDDMRCAGWHRQSSPCSVLSVASSGHLYAEPGQTLIFLDWDDTLFPCHEIFSKRQYSKRTREWMLCLGLRTSHGRSVFREDKML